MIIVNIKNYRKLNNYQLEFIKNLDNERKQQLFLEFNKVLESIQDIII